MQINLFRNCTIPAFEMRAPMGLKRVKWINITMQKAWKIIIIALQNIIVLEKKCKFGRMYNCVCKKKQCKKKRIVKFYFITLAFHACSLTYLCKYLNSYICPRIKAWSIHKHIANFTSKPFIALDFWPKSLEDKLPWLPSCNGWVLYFGCG